MKTINNIKKIVRIFHLDELAKSMKECLNDNTRGFLIPASAKLSDSEYECYRFLPVDWSIPPITKEDLPSEFSPQAVKTVECSEEKQLT